MPRNDTDVDSSSLTVTKFSLTNLPFVSFKAGETADLVIGKLTIKANGEFTFVPAKDYNGPVPSITYTLSDGSATSTATLTFDITPVNDAPVNSTPGAQTLAEDGSKVFSLFGNNSVAVSDVDGDKLTYVIQAGVDHGSLLLNTVTGEYTYTPNKDYNGNDTFTIRVYDAKGAYADSVVSVKVNPVNDAPVSSPSSISTNEDTPIDGRIVARDADGD
eukprot:gene43953-53738_t